ncbi:glucose dehydrogenase [FAD, quinone]-like [Anthonomus grandis grandis]|uniref:glucose dehydrogenase [FAD, quinone]-like n=1 Tax=Anthonomus grandis grandis TaxID=2921223 RepID=UPI0021657BB8|nr:glucose dehydrogenase [FAD, quinone]-like [Anthonomus grandis grandis]
MLLMPTVVLVILGVVHVKGKVWNEFVEEIGDYLDTYRGHYSPTNNDEFFKVQNDSYVDIVDYGSYDFIVVGAGAAGSVLANRLTEGSFTVLLLEAGDEGADFLTILGLSTFLTTSKWNWGYTTTTQSNSCYNMPKQQCSYPRGKALGGSSVINTGMYVRGNARDYDKWESLGNSGWSYKDCLPYFKKSERAQFDHVIDKEYHGFDGVQAVGIPPDSEGGLTTKLLEAAKYINKSVIDYNGASQDGIGRCQFYLDFNRRTSGNYAYIQPVINRTNLNVTIEALVTKILLDPDQKMAQGVEFYKKGQRYMAKANKEVIVSGGTINSPQLLMLSGIGPKEELDKHNIEVFEDLPVGKYLSDHMFYTGVCFSTNQTFYNNSLLQSLERWKKGLRTFTEGGRIQTVGFVSFDEEEGVPMVEFSLAFGSINGFMDAPPDEHTDALHTHDPFTQICAIMLLLHPKSVGEVTLKSSDPRDFPNINPNYLTTPYDFFAYNSGIQEVIQLLDSEVFRSWNATLNVPRLPHCDKEYHKLTTEWWFCTLVDMAGPGSHPIGTTRMGTDPRYSVVTPELKIHGWENLRVVDAGVIPYHTSGNLNAPTVMIAEKISDVIKKTWGS